MNKRYAAALALAAVAVLITGVLFRPAPATPKHNDPPKQPAPAQGSELRQMSEFFSARTSAIADHLVWVNGTSSTGVRWTDGQIVTTASGLSVVRTVPAPDGSNVRPVVLAPQARLDQGGWVVVAARNEEGSVVSASGMLGGAAAVKCGTEEGRKLLFNVPLEAAYAGGGVFDMSGRLLGIVVLCSDAWVAVTHDTVGSWLQRKLGPEAVTWIEFGVRTREPSEAERQFLRLPEAGLFVAEVRRASLAANMGIQPGDVIDLPAAAALGAPRETIPIVRNRRKLELAVSPPFSLERPDEGAVLTSVQPETRLGLAGLQPGDRIADPRALTSRGSKWLIYRREDREIGVLLP